MTNAAAQGSCGAGWLRVLGRYFLINDRSTYCMIPPLR